MQEEADRRKVPMSYTLVTDNLSMWEWAKAEDKGGSVFEWDEVYEVGRALNARKKIWPRDL